MLMITGKEFKGLLATHGIKQKDVVKESGLAPATVSTFISGANTKLGTYTRIIEAYHRLLGDKTKRGLRNKLIGWMHDHKKDRKWLAPKVKSTPEQITTWLSKDYPQKPSKWQAHLLEGVTQGFIKAKEIDERY